MSNRGYFNMDDNRWRYESDGETYARTYYVWRCNPDTPTGLERRDFPSRKEAQAFIKEANECLPNLKEPLA
jgi:hypothetical protein